MKTLTLSTIAMIILTVFYTSCKPENKKQATEQKEVDTSVFRSDTENIVKVVAKDFKFHVDDEIRSGWTTFQFENKGHAVHFFLFNRLPDTIPYSLYHEKVSMPFQIVFDSIKTGTTKADAGAMLGEMIPAWYFAGVKSMGGTGFIEGGNNTQITVNIEPGTYVMECYIKEKGVFHTTLGMMKEVKVLDETTKMKAPISNIELTLSNHEITSEGNLEAGKNTVAVHFKEHPEIGLGNDVHLIKLTENTDMDKVISWLDWMNVEGLEPPSPVEFLGGVQEMPVGYTAYFTVDIEPGNYAWISESYGAVGMVKKFKVE